jgi:hypothetical protein
MAWWKSRVRVASAPLSVVMDSRWAVSSPAKAAYASRRKGRRFATGRLRFLFDVTVATRDRAILEELGATLGHGSITDSLPKRGHFEPTRQFRIASLKAHRAATIPFMQRLSPQQ